MTLFDTKQVFEQAILKEHDAIILLSFLRVIAAVEHTVHWQIAQIQAVESRDNPELYRQVIHMLLNQDMLAAISSTSSQQAIELRHSIDTGTPQAIIDWYHNQWSGAATTATEILISIASALRTVISSMYGQINLLRQQLRLDTTQEAVLQRTIEAVDVVRACRNQLGRHLDEDGVKIPQF